jgi:hypothetical protein
MDKPYLLIEKKIANDWQFVEKIELKTSPIIGVIGSGKHIGLGDRQSAKFQSNGRVI